MVSVHGLGSARALCLCETEMFLDALSLTDIHIRKMISICQ